MAYLEGVKTGYATGGGNPFSVIVSRVKEAQARKLAEQKEDKKELRELEQVFQTLAKKHEYDTQIEEQKRQVGLDLEKEKGVQDRLNKLSEGYTFDDSGNAIEPEQQTIQAQPVDKTQRLLQMTGLAMPSKPVNRAGEMAPVVKTQPKKQDNSMLAEQFGLGKGVKLKKKNDVETQLKEENLKYMQSINKKMTEGDGTDLVYRKADTGEEVTKEEAEAAIANGDRNYLVNQRITTKSGTSEKPLIKPPDLTKEEKEYVNASRRIGEALGDMSTRFTEIAKSKKGSAGWKKAQVQMKLPFSLEYAAVQDQDLQYIKSSIDKVKADIPFLRGGKQLTNTEAKRIDILLNPFGKSDATIQRDIKRFQEEFSFGEKLMIGGVSAISRQGEPSKKIGRFTIESE